MKECKENEIETDMQNPGTLWRITHLINDKIAAHNGKLNMHMNKNQLVIRI